MSLAKFIEENEGQGIQSALVAPKATEKQAESPAQEEAASAPKTPKTRKKASAPTSAPTPTPAPTPEDTTAPEPKAVKEAVAEPKLPVQEIQDKISTKLMRIEDLRDQLRDAPDISNRVRLRNLLAENEEQLELLRESRRTYMKPGEAQALDALGPLSGKAMLGTAALPLALKATGGVSGVLPPVGLAGFRPEEPGAEAYVKEAKEFVKRGGAPERSRSAFFTPTPTVDALGPLTEVGALSQSYERADARVRELESQITANENRMDQATAEIDRLKPKPTKVLGMPVYPDLPTKEEAQAGKEAKQLLAQLQDENRRLSDEAAQLRRIRQDALKRAAAAGDPIYYGPGYPTAGKDESDGD